MPDTAPKEKSRFGGHPPNRLGFWGLTLEQEQAVVKIRRNPRLWMESCAHILRQDTTVAVPILNEFQREVNKVYRWCQINQKPCRIVIVKPRRKGSSTISLGLLYTHLRNYTAYGAILGDDLATTDKLKEIWNLYGRRDGFAYWGNRIKQNMTEFSHGSKLYSETANDPRAGMSGDIHFLLATEAAHYRRTGKSSGEAVMNSIVNSVPKLWNSVIIMESTPNGAQGVFYNTYQGAVSFEDFKDGKTGNGFIRVFAPWFAFDNSRVENITPEQEAHIMNTLDDEPRYRGEAKLVKQHGVTPDKLAWRREIIDSPACGGDPKKFDQEFPSDDVSCFHQSGSARFDWEGVEAMEKEVQSDACPCKYGVLEMPEGATMPVFLETDRSEAWLRLWEKPKEGLRYAGAADYMRGKQASASNKETDTHVYGIGRALYMDSEGVEHKDRLACACMPDDRMKYIDVLVERQALMLKWYGNPPLAPEINVHGDALVELMEEAGINVWHRTKTTANDKKVEIAGFETTGKSKRQIINTLATAIRDQTLEVYCPRAISELKHFITHADGEESAAEGHHDDWVLFLAILAHVLPAAVEYKPEQRATPRPERERRKRMAEYA